MTTTNEAVEAPRGPVAVIGAGTIGAGWAAFFALSGLEVRVADISDKAESQVLAVMERARKTMEALGTLSPNATVPVVTKDIAEAVRGAVHVQEVLPEEIGIKRQAYAAIESALDADAIIASSSSGLLPSTLQEGMRHPERLLIAHPNNPPYLMPTVEIVGGSRTAAWALDAADAFYSALGKQTIRLRREVTGHLINRLQAALWREAVHLVAEGYASAADVDRAITDGLGARWAVCGPHMIFHLSGGPDGMAGFLERLGPAVTNWWNDLGNPVLDEATRQALIDGMNEAAQGRSYAELAAERDRRMIPVLVARKA